jgi:hypothetical protein
LAFPIFAADATACCTGPKKKDGKRKEIEEKELKVYAAILTKPGQTLERRIELETVESKD